ncbi:Ornithine decarboxylase 1, partial [Stegodyphus mimosarum]
MDGSKELNEVVNGYTKDNLFHLLASKSSKKVYKSMFEYLNDVGKQVGQEQAFYTFDFADMLYKLQLWKEKLPDVRPYYAVKVNSDPVLLRLFVLLGLSFDCATEGEIRMVVEAGGDPRNVVFAHTFKTPRALKYASSVGVDLMTFDAEEELLKIHEEYPETRLLLRLSPKDVQCAFDLSEKFGCKLDEIHYLLSRAKELNLKVVGVSFHVGALCTEPGSFISTIYDTRKVFDEAKKLGFKFTIVDIGGGFFGCTEREKIFHDTSEKIKQALKENFPEEDVEFIAEPGCYFAASAITLTTAIIGKKSMRSNSSSKDDIRRHYFLNDGIYGSFFRGIEAYDIRPVPLLKEN